MNMKAPLPPDFKKPMWATRDFRLLIIGVVMGIAVSGMHYTAMHAAIFVAHGGSADKGLVSGFHS